MNGIEFDEEVEVKVDKLSDLHHRGLLQPNQWEMNTTTNIMVVVVAVRGDRRW